MGCRMPSGTNLHRDIVEALAVTFTHWHFLPALSGLAASISPIGPGPEISVDDRRVLIDGLRGLWNAGCRVVCVWR
jgi:hypothetical protein